MLILLMGPPGVGKGTQLLLLQKEFEKIKLKYKHFIFGDEFRRLSKTDHVLKSKISSGELIDDNTVNSVFDKLDINPVEIVILDGYPRSIAQAEHLKKFKVIPIFFDANFEVLKHRLLHRKQCVDCGYCSSIDNEVCTKCGSKDLKLRSDDKIEIINNRLDEYSKITKPMQNYYANSVNFKLIDANQKVDLIHTELINHVKKYI